MSYKIDCHINNQDNHYEIVIEPGLIKDYSKIANELSSLASRFAIISDDSAAFHHGHHLSKQLSQNGLEVQLFTFPDGEKYKSRLTKQRLENQLLKQQYGRDTCIIALGGGVVCDVVGFLSSTYCRGVPLIIIPTTLLCMVDASIGGKNGVDVPEGKNLIGTIYQPKMVWIDPFTLKTLPISQIRNGFVEMIKHAIIQDSNYFEFLLKNSQSLIKLDSKLISKAIYDSCMIKKNIIEEDVRENGKRRLVNFGHTIGHAIEQLSRFSIPHGSAVSIGMIGESIMAELLGYATDLSKKTSSILNDYGLPLNLDKKFTPNKIINAMKMDKKAIKGTPRFPIIKEVGIALPFNGSYCTAVNESVIKTALTRLSNDLCLH